MTSPCGNPTSSCRMFNVGDTDSRCWAPLAAVANLWDDTLTTKACHIISNHSRTIHFEIKIQLIQCIQEAVEG